MAGKTTVGTIQLGDSGTAANNFYLKPNLDGTISLNRGNDGALIEEVLKIDANGVVRQKAQSMVRLNTANGYGSTNTAIRRYLNVDTNQGNDITYSDSAANGASFTINTSGVYAVSVTGAYSVAFDSGISLNSAQLTTGVAAISASDRLAASSNVGGSIATCCWVGYLPVGSVIRPHTGVALTATGTYHHFTITRVA